MFACGVSPGRSLFSGQQLQFGLRIDGELQDDHEDNVEEGSVT